MLPQPSKMGAEKDGDDSRAGGRVSSDDGAIPSVRKVVVRMGSASSRLLSLFSDWRISCVMAFEEPASSRAIYEKQSREQ